MRLTTFGQTSKGGHSFLVHQPTHVSLLTLASPLVFTSACVVHLRCKIPLFVAFPPEQNRSEREEVSVMRFQGHKSYMLWLAC
ncbi:hypothetical protein MRB53_034486 [Persea americana]|uniref:Uncharacterized protein n=1 Tax=Persea americana TaxID=3435 RepID=A0ACC2K1X5_PERAE|nr:hypothetical protein MRB53_034486 [Persea americana]